LLNAERAQAAEQAEAECRVAVERAEALERSARLWRAAAKINKTKRGQAERERDGLRQRIAAEVCGACGGNGAVDSGGQTPWGEGIDIPCGECNGRGWSPTHPLLEKHLAWAEGLSTVRVERDDLRAMVGSLRESMMYIDSVVEYLASINPVCECEDCETCGQLACECTCDDCQCQTCVHHLCENATREADAALAATPESAGEEWRRMRRELAYYGDRSNWGHPVTGEDGQVLAATLIGSDPDGERARKALGGGDAQE